MNKIIFGILSLVILTSCRSDIEPLFRMPIEADFTIPAGLSGILTHTFVVADVKNPIETFLDAANVDTAEVANIRGGRGELRSVFSETNFEFVNRVSIWILDTDNPDIRKEIHYLDLNQDNNSDGRLQLLTGIADVSEILKKETFDLEIKLEFRGFSPRETRNRFIFDLEAFK